METAKVKRVIPNKETGEITVIIDADKSIFFEKNKRPYEWTPPMFVNGSSIIDGFNLVLEKHFNEVKALKKDKESRAETIDTLERIDSFLVNLLNEGRNVAPLRARLHKIMKVK
jgi:hypothetical protein